MSQTLKITFWVRKGRINAKGEVPIVVRICLCGERLDFHSNHHVKEKDWDAKKSRVKGKDVDALTTNTALDLIKTKLWEAYHKLVAHGEPTANDLLLMYQGKGKTNHSLLELVRKHNEEFKRRLDVDRRLSTYEKYEFTLQKTESFIRVRKQCKDIKLNQLDKKFISDFYIFLREHEKNEHNTAAKYVKNLKHIVAYGRELGWLESHPFEGYKCGYKQTDQVLLGPDELDRIRVKRFSIPRLELARNLFLFQCYTSLSYVDMKSLEHRHIQQGFDGAYWIRLKRTKTGSDVAIPLLPQAKAILHQYNTELRPDSEEKVFPAISIQHMNAYLKEVAELCGITKNLTTHVGRRTAASTVLLGSGVPIETISRILSHQNIRTTQIYARVQDHHVKQDIERVLPLLEQKFPVVNN